MSEMTADEIVDLCLRHTLYDWQQQGSTRPIAVAAGRRSGSNSPSTSRRPVARPRQNRR